MERKIGEIFEYNGEWYQCIPHTGCELCDFNKDDGCEMRGEDIYCSSNGRQDETPVIFKKLEKVGEPVRLYKAINSLYQTYKLFTDAVIPKDFGYNYSMFPDNSYIKIEIKQTKEDMEEKKQKLDDLVGLYTSAKITYKEFDEKLKTLYADKEECKSSLKEFDLEAAKAGKPVCTRDGRKARIICFDAKGKQPIIALFEREKADEVIIQTYNDDGSYYGLGKEDNRDLMMSLEKKEGWAKVRKDINLYDTKEKADRKMIGNDEYVTAKVCWEE